MIQHTCNYRAVTAQGKIACLHPGTVKADGGLPIILERVCALCLLVKGPAPAAIRPLPDGAKLLPTVQIDPMARLHGHAKSDGTPHAETGCQSWIRKHGAKEWKELHAAGVRAETDTSFIFVNYVHNLIQRIGCEECKKEFREYCSLNPPPNFFEMEKSFAWTVEAHNAVNAKLGRREWSVEEAQGGSRGQVINASEVRSSH